MTIIHNVQFQDHTNSLFLQSKLLKYHDLIEYQTAVFMFKARNNLLPRNIQKMFSEREGGYNLREGEILRLIDLEQQGKDYVYQFAVLNCGTN